MESTYIDVTRYERERDDAIREYRDTYDALRAIIDDARYDDARRRRDERIKTVERARRANERVSFDESNEPPSYRAFRTLSSFASYVNDATNDYIRYNEFDETYDPNASNDDNAASYAFATTYARYRVEFATRVIRRVIESFDDADAVRRAFDEYETFATNDENESYDDATERAFVRDAYRTTNDARIVALIDAERAYRDA